MARLTRRDKVTDLLKQAIEAKDVAKLKFALKYQQAKINEQDENGETVLHQSCLSGQLEIVRLLVENGAELELRDDRGWTCLHYAAFGGRVDVVNFLINSCVDVTATSLEGKLAIDVAKGEGIVFLLATAILRAGKEHLLLRYMDESTSSLQSVESETSEEDRHNWSPIHGSLSEEVLRASQQFLAQSFGAYLDEKFNLKSSFDKSREAELPAKENGTRTRKTSCPGGQNDTQGLLSPFKRPRLNSFNSAFSRDVLQRFAVSESDLTEEQVGEKEKRADINRAPNFSDLNNVNSDTLI